MTQKTASDALAAFVAHIQAKVAQIRGEVQAHETNHGEPLTVVHAHLDELEAHVKGDEQ